MKQSVAILDFGTSKITVLIGERGVNNSICIDGIGVCEYAGFSGGEWFAPDKLSASIVQAVTSAESSARQKINKLYIGVPADFLMCKVNDVTMSVNKKRRITDGDVENLHSQGNIFGDDPEWTVINIQPIYYTLDDNRKLIAPAGMTSSKIGGSISYILAKNSFIETVDRAVTSCGIEETEYVSASLAEILFLFDDYRRDNCVMLADIGALETTLTIARGDGICRQYYFPWGGDRITYALEDRLEIPHTTAELLKRKLILSLDPDFSLPNEENDVEDDDGKKSAEQQKAENIVIKREYSVEVNNETYAYPVADTNEIVRNELERLARYIYKALKGCDYDYPDITPLSVTGGGINHIRGACEYLSDCLNREVEPIKPALPMYERPQLSSALGLMDMVLSSEVDSGVGLINKFRRWLAKR
ncbi:MAG: hypothetical protein NC184_07015 [Roseburia sp.]|nr:hypothetical protein [Roseburia sp.]